jgi:hypothetical protein
MAIIGTLAIVGFLLLVVQMVFGAVLNRLTHDSQFVFIPLVLGLVCLAMAFVWGLAKGPTAVRLAVLCGFGSLAFFGYALTLNAAWSPTPVGASLAASAALFVLSITLGVVSCANERATSHESSVRK